MILYRTLSLFSAVSNTRILALLINAGQTVRTLRINPTLRFAVRWSSNKVSQTGARSLGSNNSALRIRSARVRFTWIGGHRWRWFNLRTMNKRIARKASSAAADRVMIDNDTLGVLTAGSRARVNALVIIAGLVLLALGADGTLRSTGWRCTNKSSLAGANGVAVQSSAVAIGSTGRGFARFERRFNRDWRTAIQRVSGIPRHT